MRLPLLVSVTAVTALAAHASSTLATPGFAQMVETADLIVVGRVASPTLDPESMGCTDVGTQRFELEVERVLKGDAPARVFASKPVSLFGDEQTHVDGNALSTDTGGVRVQYTTCPAQGGFRVEQGATAVFMLWGETTPGGSFEGRLPREAIGAVVWSDGTTSFGVHHRVGFELQPVEQRRDDLVFQPAGCVPTYPCHWTPGPAGSSTQTFDHYVERIEAAVKDLRKRQRRVGKHGTSPKPRAPASSEPQLGVSVQI